MNANISRIFGPFILSLCSALNFWQYNNIYSAYIYDYVFISILMGIGYLMIRSLDNKWKEPEDYEDCNSNKLYNSE